MSMRLRTAMLQMLSARAASIVMMMAFFAILGRLLAPEDFGHYAIAFGAYNLMKTLTAFGLQAYIIRAQEEVPVDALSRAAGLSLMIAGAGAALFLGAAASLGGGVLAMPLALCLLPMAAALILEPLSLATESRLHRNLSFGLPAWIATLRTLADGATAISLALLGWGAPALATGLLASQLVATVLLLAFGGAEARVWPRPTFSGLKEFGRFGSKLTSIKIAPDFTDLLLISALGAFAGAYVTGLFNRVQVIHRMIDRVLFDGINPVVLPAISTALASGMEPARVYHTKVDLLVALCWPGFAMIALMADPLVAVLLGAQWAEAVLPVRVLAGMGLFLPFSRMSLNYFAAIDELSFYLGMQMRAQVVRLVLGVPAAMVSLEAFCGALVIGSAYKAGSLAVWTRREFGAGHYRPIFGRGLAITLATLAGPAALLLLGDTGPLVTLLLALPLAVAGWITALWAVGHPLFEQAREMLVAALRGRKVNLRWF